MILLDTNVVSELMRPSPARAVIEWFDRLPGGTTCTTAITVQEITYGIERLGEGKRSRELLESFERLLASGLLGPVIPFSGFSARISGFLLAARQREGRPVQYGDAQIASIALEHGTTLATRNVRDFTGMRLHIVDPWET